MGSGAGSGEGTVTEAGVIERDVGGSKERKVQVLEQTESLTSRGTDGKHGREGVYDSEPAGELFTFPQGFLPKDATERAESCTPETPHASRQRVPQPHTTGRHQCVRD